MASDKCWKCGKDMLPPEGEASIKGVVVKAGLDTAEGKGTIEGIEYFNRQLGKYSDGQGGCDIGICYECYIDGLFGKVPKHGSLSHF